MRCPQLTTLISLLVASTATTTAQNTSNTNPSDEFITRDVAIVGGGATGTYAAIRLRDAGKSVIVIEKKHKLGGHTDTYYDHAAGPIDYGVWVYTNMTEARAFFSRLNIPLTVEHLALDPAGSLRYDFRTGEEVPAPAGNVTEAMMCYVEILMRHPYLENGYDLPDPVPEDLLLPFRDFAARYDLGPAVGLILGYAHGHGDVMNDPALYVLKDCNLGVIQAGQDGFLRPASRANQDTYTAAERELEGDVLFGSTVVEVDRPHSGSGSGNITITVNTPSGRKQIQAQKILITIPPFPKVLSAFDLDHREAGILGKFQSSAYYNTVLRIDGLPSGSEVLNAAAETPYNVPVLPGLYILGPAAPEQNLYVAYFGGLSEPLRKQQVLQTIRENVLSLRNAGYPVSEPEVRAYGDHYPYMLRVDAKEIAGGFYRRLYGLQGYRGTYWTGATFHAPSSSASWRFTERVLQEYFL